MITYRVKIVDASGAVKIRLIEAGNRQELESDIRRSGQSVVSAIPARLANPRGTRFAAKVSSRTLPEFTSMLSALLDSALSLRDSLAILEKVGARHEVKALAAWFGERIDKGESFSLAISGIRKGIPPVYLGLVRIGERTGDLALSFKRLASYLEERKKAREAIAGAMAYPIAVMSLLVFGSIAVSVYALPRLMEIFSQLGEGAVVGIGEAMAKAKAAMASILAAVLASGVITIVAGVAYRVDAKVRLLLDKALLSLPLVGTFLRESQTLDFAFAMEALTSSGVTLDDALEEAVKAVSNSAFAFELVAVRGEIRRGSSMSTAFSSARLLPDYLKQWLAVGERTGRMDKVFGNVRQFYQSSVERWTKKFLAMVEPGMSVIVGGIVILFIFAFVLPLFTAYANVL